MKEFPCTQCGACCRRAQNLMPTKEDGTTCVYLKDNKCSIYADRPEICRINSVYNKEEMSLAEWHYKNAEICNKFIEEDGLDESFKINLSKILHHVSDNS